MKDIVPDSKLHVVSMIMGVVALIPSLWLLGLWLVGDQGSLNWVSWNLKQNAAVALVVLSCAIIFYSLKNRPKVGQLAGRICGLIALLIGALTLAEYALDVNLHIDQLIASDPAQDESALYPARMAPNMAFAITIFGLGIYLIDWRTFRGRHVADALFAIVAVLAGVAVIGYAYQSAAFYQVSRSIRMSEFASVLLIVLVLAAFISRPEHATAKLFFNGGPEGVLIRKMFPAAIFIPLIILGITMGLREVGILSRPTGYTLAASALVIIFSILAWHSARAVSISESERRRLFDQERTAWATLNEIGQSLVAELNQEKLVQAVTDAATRLSGAQFGAFFYSVKNDRGESFQLYTISGVPREMFSKFPMPRSTNVFAPTFLATGNVRSDDITKDPRYGHNTPYRGMPAGNLPVRSYLAVPVVSRGGRPVGGLFFGHEKPGIFNAQTETMVEGLAAQAAVAMDNANLYQKLEDSVRVRDEFLSIASHELKTPLTTLKLQSQIRERFLAKGDFAKFSAENLNKMIRSDSNQINRIVRLVDDMLDIGRINSGKLTLHLESFDLGQMALEVTERMRPQFAAARVELRFHAPQPVKVLADGQRIDQVMVNLLSNALKYGDGKPVSARVLERGGRAVLEVSDHGIGIAQANHELIFGRFERAASGSGISGLGLGLFIVKQILDLHQGHIRVESKLGYGSTFVVDLPLES